MSVDSDKSKRLKAILKVGEETLVTHKGDSEDSLLKSSSTLGAVNSNQEFVNHVLFLKLLLVWPSTGIRELVR